jgi:hypothetical protein
MRRTARLIGRLLGRRTRRRRRTDVANGAPSYVSARTPRRRSTDTARHTSLRSIARELAISVGETALDPRTIDSLEGITLVPKAKETELRDELFCLDAYSVEFAIERVKIMPGQLRRELIAEYREKLGDLGADLDVYQARAEAYADRLSAELTLAQTGVVRGISATVGEAFDAHLGTENALLADAVGRRFIGRTEVLKEYIETSVREMAAG